MALWKPSQIYIFKDLKNGCCIYKLIPISLCFFQNKYKEIDCHVKKNIFPGYNTQTIWPVYFSTVCKIIGCTNYLVKI